MEYTLELKSGKKVPMYFGVMTMENFCKAHNNLSFDGLQELFSSGISFTHMIDLLYYGAEFYCTLNKKPFDFTRVDASVWIDQSGGILSDKMITVLKLVGATINPAYQGVEEVKKEEKKSESVGLNLESTVLEPA
jgi:hypothetical protein